jgi:hypothetical protein
MTEMDSGLGNWLRSDINGSISKTELAFASSAPTLVRTSSDRINSDAVI